MNLSLDPSILISDQTVAKLKTLSQAGENQRSEDELKKAAGNFEAILANFLIKAMWKTIPDSGLFDESSAINGYTDIMQSALSEEITRLGGFGIAQGLYEEMKRGLLTEYGKEKE